MASYNIKSVIVYEEEYLVPESFEVDRVISRTRKPMFIARDRKSKKKFVVSKIFLEFENLSELNDELASSLAQFYLNFSKSAKLHHLLLPEDYPLSNHYFKIVEFMDTDMCSIIRSPQTLTADHVRYFLYQLLLHLHYLHSHNLSLINFSPSVILLSSDCELKLCEPLFNLKLNCNRIYQTKKFNEYVNSTKWYLAPENFISNDSTLKSDMWSLGCIFYEQFV